jgi:hypothetical protein
MLFVNGDSSSTTRYPVRFQIVMRLIPTEDSISGWAIPELCSELEALLKRKEIIEWLRRCNSTSWPMLQRFIDSAVLGIFSVLYSCAVVLLKLRPKSGPK